MDRLSITYAGNKTKMTRKMEQAMLPFSTEMEQKNECPEESVNNTDSSFDVLVESASQHSTGGTDKITLGTVQNNKKGHESNTVSETLPVQSSKKGKEIALAPKTPKKHPSKKHKVLNELASIPETTNEQPKSKKKRKHKTSGPGDQNNNDTAIVQPLVYTPLGSILKVNVPYNVQIRVVKLWCGKLYGPKHPVSMVFIARDQEDSTMEVVVPDLYCKRYKAILHEGTTYSITNIFSGVSSRPFKVLPKNRQLFLDASSKIAPLEDTGIIGRHTCYYETLDHTAELSKRPAIIFDIVAYVVDMTFPIGKTVRGENKTRLVELSIVDKTLFDVPTILTIWEDVFKNYPDQLTQGFLRPFLIVAHGVHAKLFLGKPILESTGFTEISFNNHSLAQARKLYQWVHKEYSQKQLEERNLALTDTSDINRLTIKELIDQTSKPPTKDENRTYTVIADLIYIFVDQEMYYESCPACKSRAPNGTVGSYRCSGCDKMQNQPITRLKIKATIEDLTDAANIVLFHRQAQTILHEPVETIKDLKKQRNSTALLNKMIDKCLNITYKFVIKVSEANHKYISSQGYTVSEVERIAKPYNPEDCNMLQLLSDDANSESDDTDADEQSEDDNSLHNDDAIMPAES